MKTPSQLALMLAATLWIAGCGESPSTDADNGDSTHTHADGTVHKDGDPEPTTTPQTADDHGHDRGEELALPCATIGGMDIAFAQGHGPLKAGQESHLIIKLPYNDKGETKIIAWIGTEDRTLSNPMKAEYAPSHDDYDVHSVAPSPLPENVMWWIEIQKPDGTKVVGSTKPITE